MKQMWEWGRGYALLVVTSLIAFGLCALLLDRSNADGSACRADGTAEAADSGDAEEQSVEADDGEVFSTDEEAAQFADRVTAESDAATGVVVVFGRRSGARDVQIILGPTNSDSEPSSVAVIDDVVREAGGDSLSDSVTSSVKQHGSKNVLHVCVERGSAGAGTYTGTLEVGEIEETATFVPLEIRLSPTGWDAVMLAWLPWAAVVIAGMAFVYWSASPTEEAFAEIMRTSPNAGKRFGFWIWRGPALAGLLAGLFAALGVFSTVFISDDSWGDNLLGDLSDLGSKMGAAFVALALTTYRLASKTRTER
jgi:hypothetical protein